MTDPRYPHDRAPLIPLDWMARALAAVARRHARRCTSAIETRQPRERDDDPPERSDP